METNLVQLRNKDEGSVPREKERESDEVGGRGRTYILQYKPWVKNKKDFGVWKGNVF